MAVPRSLQPRLLLGILLLSVAALASGCGNPCDRMCTAQADLLERCFPTWNSSWEDQSYTGRAQFIDRCAQVWGEALDELGEGSAEWDSLSSQCERELETALADSDCESVLSIDP